MAKQQYVAKSQTAPAAPETKQEEQLEQTPVDQQTEATPVDTPAGDEGAGTEPASADSEEPAPTEPETPAGEGTQFEEEVPFEEPNPETSADEQPSTASEVVSSTESVVEPAPVQEPVAPVATTPTQEPTMTTELTASAAARFEVEAPQVASLKQQLAAYIGDMAPGRRMSDSDGGRKQAQLANLLVDSLTQSDPKVFIGCMATWLDLITQHRTGVFNERYVFRFASDIPLAKPKQQQWQHLMSVMLAAADGKNLTETVDLQRALLSLGDEFAARFRTYVERRSQR